MVKAMANNDKLKADKLLLKIDGDGGEDSPVTAMAGYAWKSFVGTYLWEIFCYNWKVRHIQILWGVT